MALLLELAVLNTRTMKLMKTNIYLLLAFLGLSLMSCATGKNAFDKGNYETAIDRAINRLQANPDNKKARGVLQNGYEVASAYHLDLIRNYENGGDAFRWESIHNQYSKLNNYYNKIRRCPACMNLVAPELYQTEMEQAANAAAQNRMRVGKQALQDSTIEGGRSAYRNFQTALRFNNAIPGIDELLTTARNMGTVRVVVEPIPIHSRSLELTNEYFENQLLEYLNRYSANRFVEFYQAREAENIQLRPDHIISMQFDDFVLGQTLIESKSKEVSRDSVIVGNYTDSDGVEHDVYGTVKAEVTRNRKTLASTGIMNFEIIDAYSGRTLIQRKFPSEDIWVHEWATFNGDERALTKQEIKLSKLRELPPPLPQDLFISFIDRIYGQITGQISSFYRSSRI